MVLYSGHNCTIELSIKMRVKLLKNWSYYNKGQVLYQDKLLAKKNIKEGVAIPFEGETEDEKEFRKIIEDKGSLEVYEEE